MARENFDPSGKDIVSRNKVGRTPEQMVREYEETVKAILKENGVAAIVKAAESELKDKGPVIEALKELDELVDNISTNLCDPPFDLEAWSQMQKVREAVQDAQEHFEKTKYEKKRR